MLSAMAMRYDRGEMRKPAKTAAGFLRADAFVTRTGVFAYRRDDGTIRRELRLPDEVFKADSLASLAMAPLTMGHPKEPVHAGNARKLSVGTIGEQVRPDGRYVAASLMVTDGEAVSAIEARRGLELSCGYHCDLEEAPGVHEGEPYDAIQRGIAYNHVALVERGRAGPDVCIRLDSADAVMVDDAAPSRKDAPMTVKLRLDGVDYDVSEQALQAVKVRLDRADAELAAEKARATEAARALEQEKARADAAQEAAQAAKAELAKAQAPEALQAAVKARVALEQAARATLGAEAKLDGLDDLSVMKAVVIKVSPAAEAKLKDASPEYVRARYDQALETPAVGSGLEKLRLHADGASPEQTAEAKRAAMIAEQRDAWKQPLASAKSA
jgi:hypothetical protein